MAFSGVEIRTYLDGVSKKNYVINGQRTTAVSATLPTAPLNTSILLVMVHWASLTSVPATMPVCDGFDFTLVKGINAAASASIYLGKPNGQPVGTLVSFPSLTGNFAMYVMEIVGADPVNPIARSGARYVASNSTATYSYVVDATETWDPAAHRVTYARSASFHTALNTAGNSCYSLGSPFGAGVSGFYGVEEVGTADTPPGAGAPGQLTGQGWSEIAWGDEEHARTGSTSQNATCGFVTWQSSAFPMAGTGLGVTIEPLTVRLSQSDTLYAVDAVQYAGVEAIFKGNGKRPGTLLGRDTFNRVDSNLEGSTFSDGPYLWTLSAEDINGQNGASVYTGTRLLDIRDKVLRIVTPRENFTTNSPVIGPHFKVPNHLSDTINVEVKLLHQPGIGVKWGVYFGMYFASFGSVPNLVEVRVVTGVPEAWRVTSGGGSSGSTRLHYDASAEARVGDIIRFTWEGEVKRVAIYNVTKNRLWFHAGFQEPGYSAITGPGAVNGAGIGLLHGHRTDGTASLVVDDLMVFTGPNAPLPYAPHIDSGTATSEKAVVSVLGTPVVDLELWESGIKVADLGSFPVSGEAVISASFNAALLADPTTGAGVELRVRSHGGSVDIGGIAWDARYAGLTQTEKVDSDTATGVDTGDRVGYYVQGDSGTGIDAIINFIDGERVYRTDSETATVTEAEQQKSVRLAKLPPDAIVASSNTTGVVAYIQDDPDTADSLHLEATSEVTPVDVRVSFPTPDADLYISGSQRIRIKLKETT